MQEGAGKSMNVAKALGCACSSSTGTMHDEVLSKFVAVPTNAKVAPKHPPYFDMVKEVITATGTLEKGATRASIGKYMEAKYGCLNIAWA